MLKFSLIYLIILLLLCIQNKQFNELITEKEAIQYFESFLKDNTMKLDPAFISICMNRGWWDAAERITIYYVERKVDVSSHIYRASNVIKSNVKRITDLLTNLGKPFSEVPPAFQWAQSSEQILLNVKYASRWDTPATLGCEHENLTCSDQELYYSVVCASVGRAVITIEKKEVSNWPFLLVTKKKPGNMHPWYAMEEQLKNEPLKRTKSTNNTNTTETVNTSTETNNTTTEPTPVDINNNNNTETNNNKTSITDEEFNLLAEQYGGNKNEEPNNNNEL